MQQEVAVLFMVKKGSLGRTKTPLVEVQFIIMRPLLALCGQSYTIRFISSGQPNTNRTIVIPVS